VLRSIRSDLPPAPQDAQVRLELGGVVPRETRLGRRSQRAADRVETLEHLLEGARRGIVRKRSVRSGDALEVCPIGS
jgi:hypothetical protein